jgi:hypothetical protein
MTSKAPSASAQAAPAPGRMPSAVAPVQGAALPTRRDQALMALENSRRALRAELMPAPPADTGAHDAADAARRWLRRLRRWPAGQLVREAAQQWWKRQPWHPVVSQAVSEARAHGSPVLQRHPWWVAGAGAALGVAVVTLRPWRWAWVGHHVRRAPGLASRWLARELTAAPMQALILGLATMLLRQSSGQAPPRPGPAPEPPPERVREPDAPPAVPIGDPGRAPPATQGQAARQAA